MMAVILRAAGLYLAGNRASAMGSMMRCCRGGRGADAAPYWYGEE